MKKTIVVKVVTGSIALGCAVLGLRASSHREAPLITAMPKLDATDFYMFNSYEDGRSNYVTIVANYLPDQSPTGGPNFFMMETNALYEIHIDNNGDAREDITFQFRFTNEVKGISLPIGPAGNQVTNPVPLINVGSIAAGDTANLNVIEKYSLTIIRGDRRTGAMTPVTGQQGTNLFIKPVDNIGNKSIPDYTNYANSYIYTVNFPGSTNPGKLFVGQRKDPFVVNLGETFDLINLNPVGPAAIEKDALAGKNVTSFILEVPKDFLTAGTNVIAAWTTASKIEADGTNQVSRLGHALVNELVIGLPDKDLFNSVMPTADAALAQYVTHPTFPAIVELLFSSAGVKAPTLFPRSDLVSVFLTGVAGVNQTSATAEMLRLNTATPTVPANQQNNLGVIAGDTAGYPNGRRPGDDIVDITLRVAMGVLLSTNDAPSGQLPYTDGAYVDASRFYTNFPYLKEPLAGSPNDLSVLVTLEASTNGAVGPFTAVPAVYDPQQRKLVTPKTDDAIRIFRLNADGPVNLDARRIDTVPNVQLGITR
ncbi:MAG: DUF4331 domain-containing protein [Verrucomicrobiota bacterium]